MSARIIDGKAIAAGVRASVAAAVKQLPGQPALAVVLVGDDPASKVYVASKGKATTEAGMRSVEIRMPAETQEADLIARVDALSRDSTIAANGTASVSTTTDASTPGLPIRSETRRPTVCRILS
jgi:methylenetetrahydrofolate dehydrogenase (NADP+)/methenyltetrahydrofolate cyclohydrolase